MFAIIKSGGKQYKIAAGDIIKLEYLGLKKGEDVTFDKVLLLQDDKSIEFGTPTLPDAKVQGKILENKNDKKVIVFKKRRRHNSRRLNGHKRILSVVRINEISYKGQSIAKFTDSAKNKKVKNKTKPSTKKDLKKKILKETENGT